MVLLSRLYKKYKFKNESSNIKFVILMLYVSHNNSNNVIM